MCDERVMQQGGGREEMLLLLWSLYFFTGSSFHHSPTSLQLRSFDLVSRSSCSLLNDRLTGIRFPRHGRSRSTRPLFTKENPCHLKPTSTPSHKPKHMHAQPCHLTTTMNESDSAFARLNDKVDMLLSKNEQLNSKMNRLIKASKKSAFNDFETPKNSDVLELNVGGTPVNVIRGTLTCIPGLLATKFKGDWDASLPRDTLGRFYVEEDPELFAVLISYLREYNRMLIPTTGCLGGISIVQ
jgi:hypothetical protein